MGLSFVLQRRNYHFLFFFFSKKKKRRCHLCKLCHKRVSINSRAQDKNSWFWQKGRGNSFSFFLPSHSCSNKYCAQDWGRKKSIVKVWERETSLWMKITWLLRRKWKKKFFHFFFWTRQAKQPKHTAKLVSCAHSRCLTKIESRLDRPVLKHGPRSLTHVQVAWWFENHDAKWKWNIFAREWDVPSMFFDKNIQKI